jgi:hypothetical protein
VNIVDVIKTIGLFCGSVHVSIAMSTVVQDISFRRPHCQHSQSRFVSPPNIGQTLRHLAIGSSTVPFTTPGRWMEISTTSALSTGGQKSILMKLLIDRYFTNTNDRNETTSSKTIVLISLSMVIYQLITLSTIAKLSMSVLSCTRGDANYTTMTNQLEDCTRPGPENCQ